MNLRIMGANKTPTTSESDAQQLGIFEGLTKNFNGWLLACHVLYIRQVQDNYTYYL